MREVYHNKLVRDNIPKIIEGSGDRCTTKVLESDSDYFYALNNKLLEEVGEYLECKSMKELIDVVEVISAIVDLKSDKKSFEKLREQKAKSHGAFQNRIFLERIFKKD